MVGQGQEDILQAILIALSIGVAESVMSSYVINGFPNTLGNSKTAQWQKYLRDGWTIATDEGVTLERFLDSLSYFYELLDGGETIESARARGRGGAF